MLRYYIVSKVISLDFKSIESTHHEKCPGLEVGVLFEFILSYDKEKGLFHDIYVEAIDEKITVNEDVHDILARKMNVVYFLARCLREFDTSVSRVGSNYFYSKVSSIKGREKSRQLISNSYTEKFSRSACFCRNGEFM